MGRVIHCAGTRLDISKHIDTAREDAAAGRGWVWDHLGLTTPISVDDLKEKLRLYDDATINKDSRTKIPDHCRYFYWPARKVTRKPARSRPRP